MMGNRLRNRANVLKYKSKTDWMIDTVTHVTLKNWCWVNDMRWVGDGIELEGVVT